LREVWPLFEVFIFFDCMQAVTLGLVNGLGIIRDVRWVTFISYWLIGIPLAYYLIFYKQMGLLGLWCGPTIANIINFVAYDYTVRTKNWY
jgi:MATE family multidrug resistance protein